MTLLRTDSRTQRSLDSAVPQQNEPRTRGATVKRPAQPDTEELESVERVT